MHWILFCPINFIYRPIPSASWPALGQWEMALCATMSQRMRLSVKAQDCDLVFFEKNPTLRWRLVVMIEHIFIVITPAKLRSSLMQDIFINRSSQAVSDASKVSREWALDVEDFQFFYDEALENHFYTSFTPAIVVKEQKLVLSTPILFSKWYISRACLAQSCILAILQ